MAGFAAFDNVLLLVRKDDALAIGLISGNGRMLSRVGAEVGYRVHLWVIKRGALHGRGLLGGGNVPVRHCGSLRY